MLPPTVVLRTGRCVLPVAVVCLAVGCATAQPDADELSKQPSNPVADLASVPLQINWENGVGPDDEVRLVTNFQPVAPFRLSERWNLIGRMIVPFIQQPSLAPGAPSTSGTGDILSLDSFPP